MVGWKGYGKIGCVAYEDDVPHSAGQTEENYERTHE
jgi:hypothetical protein